MNLDAHRVARRYHAAVVLRDDPTAEVVLSDRGVITTGDLRRLLEPRLGLLVNMQLRPSLEGTPNTIGWEALNEAAEVVSGSVVLHANLDPTQITVWAELLVDDDGGQQTRVGTGLPKQFLDRRLQRIADRARRLIERVRVQPQTPACSIIGEMVELVELAEAE